MLCQASHVVIDGRWVESTDGTREQCNAGPCDLRGLTIRMRPPKVARKIDKDVPYGSVTDPFVAEYNRHTPDGPEDGTEDI